MNEEHLSVAKRAVLKLGGKCARCGIADLRVLQINHMNGRGYLELRAKGYKFYKSILDSTRHLNDLNVLCANCNILERIESKRKPVRDGLSKMSLTGEVQQEPYGKALAAEERADAEAEFDTLSKKLYGQKAIQPRFDEGS